MERIESEDSMSRENIAGARRLVVLDVLRGLTIISMVAYHACWDLVYMAGKRWDWYLGTGAFLWQQSICWTFILLAGFCTTLGKKTMKRGITVFLCGAVVSLATLLVMPESPIIYGVLTLHGSSMILVALLQRAGLLADVSRGCGGSADGAGRGEIAGNALDAGSFPKKRAMVWLAVCAVIFAVTYPVSMGYLGFFRKCIIALPRWLYVNPLSSFTTYLGFAEPGFVSSDYFPLIPWFFLFLCGYFGGVLWKQRGAGAVQTAPEQLAPGQSTVGQAESAAQPSMKSAIEKSLPVRCLRFLGRHSLLIYMLHQPIIYGVVWLLYLR